MPDPLSLVIVGPGRAGGSLALAASAAGHRVVGILSRSGNDSYGPVLAWDADLPPVDLALIAVNDDAIPEVVELLHSRVSRVRVVAHVSGFSAVENLAPFRAQGPAIGGFHPLQTLPDPLVGAQSLAGSYVGVGGDAVAVALLTELAVSMSMRPFGLEDDARAAYHAGAAASSNFVVAALGLAADLYGSAGLPEEIARPLVEQVVDNTFRQGADRALTGPIARGDVETVRGQIAAAERVSGSVAEQFRLFAAATAIRAHRERDVPLWR